MDAYTQQKHLRHNAKILVNGDNASSCDGAPRDGDSDYQQPKPKFSSACTGPEQCKFGTLLGGVLSDTCSNTGSKLGKTCDPQWVTPPPQWTTGVVKDTFRNGDMLRGDPRILCPPASDNYMRPSNSYDLVLNREAAGLIFGGGETPRYSADLTADELMDAVGGDIAKARAIVKVIDPVGR